MEQNMMEMKGTEGRLPSVAPLANPYVPFQNDTPPRYELNKAIIRGTLFAGLDLPFLGMINKNNLPNTPQNELQTLEFAIQELALYLDTHRDDKDANELYQQYQRLYCEGAKKYEQMGGRLNHLTPAAGAYKWLDDPWPWEYAGNKEV